MFQRSLNRPPRALKPRGWLVSITVPIAVAAMAAPLVASHATFNRAEPRDRSFAIHTAPQKSLFPPALFDPGPQPAPPGWPAIDPSMLPEIPVDGFRLISAAADPCVPTTGGGSGTPNLDFPCAQHWGVFKWNYGEEPAGKVRAFVLLDRTGSGAAHVWIQAWVNYFNYLRDTWMPGLPYIAYYQDDAHVGDCRDFGLDGFSFATICNEALGGGRVRASQLVALQEGPSWHFANPFFSVDLAYASSYGEVGVRNALHNSLGTVLGLGNSSSSGSVMRDPLELGGSLKWYDTDDANALYFLYTAHAAHTEPN